MRKFLAASKRLIVNRPSIVLRINKLFIGVFISFLFIVSSLFNERLGLLFTVQPVSAQEIYTTGKLITVDIGKQKVFAWEGGKVVFETIASTGMRYTPTVTGTFKIQRKIPVADMKGNYPPYPPYHLKNVPNHMYFYKGYAIHGAYWHNKFGQRVSHGCVNVPVAASQWLFNWADVGTPVVVF